jgi:tetratricopeptide (TPR) repeat protein
MTEDERARELWELGTKRLSDGQVEDALELFEQSIAVKPTAEGHTFRGWALSYLGRLDEATEECKQATFSVQPRSQHRPLQPCS